MEAFIAEQSADLDSEAWKRAYDYARGVTFQDEPGLFTKALTTVRDADILGFHPLRYIVLGPFIRIAAKLEKAAWRMTPLGTLEMAAHAMGGRMDRARFVRDSARQVMAWTMFASLWAAVGSGDDDDDEPFITGTPERQGRDLAHRTFPPYSVRLPGYGWVSYKHLQPVSGAVALMVDFITEAKAMGRGKDAEDAAAAFAEKFADRLSDQTFLQSLGDFLDAMDSPDKASTFMAKFGASWVPNLLRQQWRAFDEKVRESRRLGEGDEKPGIGSEFMQRAFPGAKAGMPKVTPWGDDVMKGGSLVTRMVSPVAVKTEDANKIDHLIARFNFLHPTDPYYAPLPYPRVTIRGESFEMNDDEFYWFLRYAGRASPSWTAIRSRSA